MQLSKRVLCVGIWLSLAALSANAGTLHVTSNADSGANTLRNQIAAAASGDTIDFVGLATPATITLTSGAISTISKNLTITGPGANLLTISGNHTTGLTGSQIFLITTGQWNISGVTLTAGFVNNNYGGAIEVDNSAGVSFSTTFVSCAFTNCLAGRGGAVDVFGGHIIINQCLFAGNSCTGNTGTTGGGGGALSYGGGTIGAFNSIFSSTFANNTQNGTSVIPGSQNYGGAIDDYGDSTGDTTTFIGGCTFVGNVDKAGIATVINAESAVGSNVFVQLNNNIFANNQDASGNKKNYFQDAVGTHNKFTSQGGNVCDVGTTNNSLSGRAAGNALDDMIPTKGTNDKFSNASILASLGPLQFNGGTSTGPTQTIAISHGSPAQANGNTGVTTLDQRGATRHTIPDSGAFELVEPNATLTQSSGVLNGGTVAFGTTPIGTPVTKTFTVTNTQASAFAAPLSLSGLSVPAGYALTTAFPSSVPNGSPMTFNIQLTAVSAGTFNSAMSFTTSDGDNGDGVANPFTVNLTGAVTASPPTVITNAATSVTATGAVLNGTVNANSASTAVTFNFGPTNAYGFSVPAVPATVTGSTNTAVTAALSGLLPGATYHYQVVGVNSGGTTSGLDGQFTVNAGAVIDLEAVATGTTGNFTSGGQTWSMTGLMNSHNVPAVSAGLGAPAPGTATPGSNSYLDTHFGVDPGLVNLGGIKAPTGFTFRAASFAVWPSSNGGNNVYGTTLDSTLGTVGLNYQLIGKKNNVQVVSANVTDTIRTPAQTGTAVGGYWHNIDLTGTAFASTDIDTVEFVNVAQSGAPMTYLAVDNFTYFSLSAGNPVLTTPVTASGVNYNSSNNSINVATLTSPSGSPTGWTVATTSGGSYSAGPVATSGGGSVSINSSGVATYTPKAGFRGTDTFFVEASNAIGASTPGTVNVPVNNPTFTATLPATTATVGTAYNVAATAVTMSGGQSPYSNFSATGLPTGLSINASGVISGTPTVFGTFSSVVITATDSSTGTGAFTGSAAALTITVNAAPVVTTNPTNTTVTAGGTATFTAAASGNPVPTVQWQVSTDGGATFNNVAGATNTTLSFSTVAGQNGNQYRAVFTNSVGSATTTAATLTVNVAPSVTTNPVNATVTAGSTATFTAAASGNPAPTVQWQQSTDGGATFNNIGGATSTTLSFTTSAGQNGNQYRAVFTNSVGSATTTAATLTVNFAPSVTTNPVNTTVNAGQTATFTAAASGNPVPTVQWQFSTDGGATFQNVAGATTTTLTVPNVAAGQNGTQFRAVFTNSVGSATTTAATMTVNFAPSVTTNPISSTVAAGSTATFTAAASGNPAPTVQWQQSTDGGATFSNIAGATSTTLSFSALVSQNGNQYRAVFTNSVGSATTTAATLTVTAAPVVTTNPTNTTVNAGQTATFTAAASGTPAPTVQWQFSTDGGATFQNVAGATTTTLTVPNVAAGQNGTKFRAVFTNSTGSATTTAATMTVNFAPSVTTNPISSTVVAGSTATFTAAASGNPAPTVQWQQSTDGGATFSNIAGATSTTLSFTASAGQNGNQYRAVFTNSVGSATTTAATLTVTAAPVVTTNPTNTTVNAGQTATFTAAASGTPAPTVQWQFSTDGGATFQNVAGATTTTLTVPNVAAGQNGTKFRAVFTNSTGSATTTAATMTVNFAPSVTTNPLSQMVSGGGTATFTAAASGNPAPTVQWQQSTDGGATFNNIAGATSATLSFSTSSAQNGYQYRAVFTNSVGSATTTAATLTTNQPPTVSGTVAGQTVNDNATISAFTGVTIGDVDVPAQTLTVTIALDAAAKGALSNLGGGSYVSATGVYTFSGTAAAATTAVSGLVFTPTPNRVAVGTTETTTFTIGVNDNNGGVVADNTTTVVSTSINDAPTIVGTVAGLAVTDKTTIAPFAGITIGDVDNPAQTLNVSVTLDTAAKGSLSNLGSGTYTAATGVYTFSGTAAASTTAVRGLVFTPTENRVAPGLTETTTFTISANDSIAAAVTDGTTTVISTSVNDGPTNVMISANPTAINENDSATVSGIFNDVDVNETHTVTIDWGDGSTATVLNLPVNTFSFSSSHQYLDNPAGQPNGSFTISATVKDASNAAATGTVSLGVANVPPTVTINGAPATIEPNILISLTSTVVDPGTLDTFTYAWSVTKNGNPFATGTTTTNAAFSLTPDIEATYVVTLVVTDKDGATGTDSKTIVVDVVPSFLSGTPTYSPVPAIVNLTTAFSAITKPADADVTWEFGDMIGQVPVHGHNLTHIYTMEGTFTVTVKAKNPRSGTTTTTTLLVLVGHASFLPGTTGMRVTVGSLIFTPALDRVTFTAALPLDSPKHVPNAKVTLMVNGLSRTFTLNLIGTQSTSEGYVHLSFNRGITVPQTAYLIVQLNGRNFRTLLAQNVATDANGFPKAVLITIEFQGVTYTYVTTITFRKTGTTYIAPFGK